MNIGEAQRQQAMRNGLASRHLCLCTFLIDVDPLLAQVASANLLMRSCVTSIQSLTPTSVPTAALSRMVSIHVRVLEFHLWDLVRNGEIGLSYRQNLGNGHARRGLLQGRLAAGKNDDRKFGHDEVDRPR